MTVPSLLVLFVGGWGSAPKGKQNLFFHKKFSFLDHFISSYPVITLDAPPKGTSLLDIYRTIGAIGGEDTAPLPIILRDHRLRQVVIAGPDRYGLITHTMHNSTSALENETWEYISFPSLPSLIQAPELQMAEQVSKVEELMKFSTNTVIYAPFSSIWTMAKYQKLAPIKDTIKKLNHYLTKLIEKALDNRIRVLVVSDGGLAEEYINLEDSSIDATTKTNPLPCLLIARELEGLKSGEDDNSQSGQILGESAGKLADIAPTILSLMHIPVPAAMDGKILFERCLKELSYAG